MPPAVMWLSALLVVVLLGWAAVTWINSLVGGKRCEAPITLDVVAAPAIASTLSGLTRGAGGSCADVRVSGSDSATVADAVANPPAGQRPKVWIPESTFWLGRAQAKGAFTLPGDGTSIATSPVVVAMTQPVARQLGWPARPVPWSAMLSPQTTAVPVGIPDPAADPIGVAGLIGVQAITAALPDAGPAETAVLRRLSDQTATHASDLYQRLTGAKPLGAFFTSEQALVAYNGASQPANALVAAYPAGPVPTLDYPYVVLPGAAPGEVSAATAFLNRLLGPDARRALREAGFRDPDGAGAPTAATPSGAVPSGPVPSGPVPSAGATPSGTLSAGTPSGAGPSAGATPSAVAPGGTGARPSASRTPSTAASATAGPSPGASSAAATARPDRVPPVRMPGEDELIQVLSRWTGVQLSARILAVFDVSGSMNEKVGNQTRMSIILQAAQEGVGLLRETTDLGLWIFSTNLDGDKDYKVLVPPGPIGQQRAKLAGALAGIRAVPNGDTGLYDTTLAAYQEARRNWVPGRINLVFIATDGRNDDAKSITRAQLLAELGKLADPRRPIPILFMGLGNGVDVNELKEIASAVDGRVYTGQNASEIRRIFFSALSDFGCQPPSCRR